MYLSSSFAVKRSSLTEVRICTDRSLTFAEASAAWYMGRKTSLTNHLQQVVQRELIASRQESSRICMFVVAAAS